MYPRRLLLTLLVVGSLFGCEGQQFGAREKGALGGAALGAGLGAIVGSQSGNAGAGVAIGSAFGAISGALIGNEVDNQNEQLDARERRLNEQDRQLQENRRLISELKSKGIDVKETSRGVVVNLPDVLFAFDSAELTQGARDTVNDIEHALQGRSTRRIAVEGHTDSTGSVAYNERLSERRARSVAGELENRGIPRSRLRVIGYGESRPIASNATESGRQRNRRVEVVIENH